MDGGKKHKEQKLCNDITKKRRSNKMFQTVLELGNWGIANGLCYSSDIVSCISIRLNFVTEGIKDIGTFLNNPDLKMFVLERLLEI